MLLRFIDNQPENLIVTAYVSRSPLRVVIVWSEWVLNASEYIAVLCLGQENFFHGCKVSYKILYMQ